MKRSDGNRARLGALVLTIALGAAALLALPGMGFGKDHHGGEPAGTIESFDAETGLLVIDLAKGDTISAMVTPRTHVRCGDEGRRRHGRHSLRRGGEGSATASHRGENEGEGDEPLEGARDEGLPPGPPEGNEGPGSGDDRSERCRDQLVVGAPVKGAVIVLVKGNAVYKDVGLVPPAPAPEDEPDES